MYVCVYIYIYIYIYYRAQVTHAIRGGRVVRTITQSVSPARCYEGRRNKIMYKS